MVCACLLWVCFCTYIDGKAGNQDRVLLPSACAVLELQAYAALPIACHKVAESSELHGSHLQSKLLSHGTISTSHTMCVLLVCLL